MKENITIVDIAKEAGVSISTVSRVITGNAKVSSEKKEKIQEIIRKYDFQPNALARGLINTQTGLLGVLTADIRNPFYSTMFVSCEQAAVEMGYNLLLFNSFSDRIKEFELLDKLYRQRVDGIILIGGAVDDAVSDAEYAERINAINKKIPVVATGHLDGADCRRINIDETRAMEIVMERIARNEALNRISFIGGSSNVRTSLELHECFRRMHDKLGLKYNPSFELAEAGYNDEGGYKAMNSLLGGKYEKEIPNVVIAINDFSAMGIVRSITEHGYKIPEDISVISFDDTYLCQIVEPKLTAVTYNYRSFGQKIVSTLINLIQKKSVPEETIITPALVERGSVSD